MKANLAEWLSALLNRCQCVCSLLQAAYSSAPAVSESSTLERQLKDVAKDVNGMEKDFNILRSAKPGTWQDGCHYLREEQEHLREKKLLLLRKPEMQQLSMWS